MNRYGLILHPSDQVDGAVHLTEFEQFYQELVDHLFASHGPRLVSAVRRQ